MEESRKKRFLIAASNKYVFAILIYFMQITQDLVNAMDGLWTNPYYKGGTWETKIGRWMIRYIDAAMSGLGINPVAGLGALLFFVVGLQIVWDIFGYRHGSLKDYICSAFFICNPYVCNILSYRYTALSYAICFAMSVLAVWLVLDSAKQKGKKRVADCALATLLIIMSMAIYQTCLGIMTVLALIVLYQIFFCRDYSGKEWGAYLVDGIISGFVGGVIYLLIAKEELLRFNLAMADYQGASNFSITNIIKKIPATFKKAYIYFFSYFSGKWNGYIRWSRFTNSKWAVVLLCMYILLAVLLVIRGWKKKKAFSLLILLFAAMMPLFMNCFLFLVPDSGYMIQQSGPFALFIMLMAMLYLEEAVEVVSKPTLKKYSQILLTLLLCGLLFGEATQTIIDQEAMKEGLQADETLFQSVLGEMIATGWYDPQCKYALVGRPDSNPLVFTTDIYDKANLYAKTASFTWNGELLQRVWVGVSRYRNGIKFKKLSKADYADLLLRQDVVDMPVFPAEGCFKKVDENVIVVKIGTY
ncbi:MAG: glucosyltransferase domain-containing protein [Lachnospiraceae bacterium]|nr:glucosyltransferase domain-containing protein [Lachnospiraceae bacterium]